MYADMTFWQLDHQRHNVAIIDQTTGNTWSYGAIQDAIDQLKSIFAEKSEKSLFLILANNNMASVISYLACLQSKNTAFLLNYHIDNSLLTNLLKSYLPDWIFCTREYITGYNKIASFFGYYLFEKAEQLSIDNTQTIYPELALLLSTSGSTGSPKVVRLSYANLATNATSIVDYTHTNQKHRAITSIPISYAFGLSIINSHFTAGASILLTSQKVTNASFWQFFTENKGTTFAGVPYTFEILKKLHFGSHSYPSLRILLQAGGRLDAHLIEYFSTYTKAYDKLLYVMYGQTEATARISYLPPDSLYEKPHSIGIPIPGGELTVSDTTGELIYKGNNVMLGYAHSRADLSKGDECNGILHTGDIGSKDEDGFFYVLGRNDRFGKIFGMRINADEIEKIIASRIDCSVICLIKNEKIYIFISDIVKKTETLSIMSKTFNIHPTAINITEMPSNMINDAGKINYSSLQINNID